MRYVPVIALIGLLSSPASAQVQSRPTDAPLVTAQNESWYQQREPLHLAGDVYFPAGATVFFDGNRMVRSGHYNGVPLYADTTLEPYSVIYVPISRGLMQPYERLRRGALAGTSGSRTPSFPVAVVPDGESPRQAPIAPTALPLPLGAIGAYTPGTTVRMAPGVTSPDASPAAAPSTVPPTAIQTLQAPENNDGVWVRFAGDKWISAGPALVLDSTFGRAGEYAGFPVYTRAGADDVIYLPSRDGVVAPYRRKP